MRPTALLLLIAACAARKGAEEGPPASRAEVTSALYRQLDFVLARAEELRPATDPAEVREREETLQLAAEIVVRIVRIDPHADVPRLVERMEAAR